MTGFQPVKAYEQQPGVAHTHISVSSSPFYSFTLSANVSGALNPNIDNGRERLNPEEKEGDRLRRNIGQPVRVHGSFF